MIDVIILAPLVTTGWDTVLIEAKKADAGEKLPRWIKTNEGVFPKPPPRNSPTASTERDTKR